MLRGFAVAALIATLVPLDVQAGSREDPEVVDGANDEQRYPGVPTVEPTVDIRGVWFEERETYLVVSMELASIADAATMPNVRGNPTYAVYVFVNGEGKRTPCSGWGLFGVRSDNGGSGRHASLSLMTPVDESAETCPAETLSVDSAVDGNIVSWTIEKSAVPGLLPGASLTVARALAWSGSTWPLTPSDEAEQAPGRPFVLSGDPEASLTMDAVAEPREQPAPLHFALLAAAVFILAGLVRRSR
jgi:hypothetical protein